MLGYKYKESKNVKNKEEKTKKTISIPFTIKWPKKGERIKPVIQTTDVLISGILVTCIGLSIVSGFVDLVFFSGLSKSWYTVFAVKVAAAILFSIMSLGFTSAKFWCAMQIGAIQELQTRLKNSGYKWYKNLNKLKWKWHAAHKFLVGVSLITSISLSVVSIGSGISRNANTLKQIDEFIEQGTKYSTLVNQARDTQLSAIVKKSADNSEEEAIKWMRQQEEEVWPKIQEWQNEYTDFLNAGLDPNDKTVLETPYNGATTYFNYWTTRDRDINNLLASSKYSTSRLTENQIRTLTVQQFTSRIRQNYIATNKVASTDEVNRQMTELKDSTLEEAKAWIDTLNAIGFTKNVQVLDEKGAWVWKTVPVVFDTDENKSTKVLVDTALQQLKAFRVDVENDSGDIGESSKIFMQVGSWLEKHNIGNKEPASIDKTLDMKVSTGMGPTELIMMILIMIFGIVQEFLIALFTPKSTIDRKMLSRFDAYFGADFNIDLFLLVTYKDYLKKGIINQKTFEAKSKKCVELMEDTIEDVIVRYSKKKKPVSQIIKGSMYKFNLQDTENINDPEIVEGTITADDSEKYTVKPAKVKPVEAPKIDLDKEEPSEPVVETTKEEAKSEPEAMPIRETKPSKILRETNSPRLQRMYGDTVESQAIPATIETPVVEMKPVEAEQPAETKDEANINMEKLQKLNEALNSFESALEDK